MTTDPQAAFVALMGLFGLLGGSVLNVVIHRGPVVWGLVSRPSDSVSRYDFFLPRSHCSACGHTLGAAELVPIVSWLAQRGRCRACGSRISAQYPAVEGLGLFCGLLAGIAYPMGAAPVALAFLLGVVGAAVIDAKTGYLPDALTGLATWIALLSSAGGLSIAPAAAILGAATGYLAFRGIAAAYEALRGREGLGRGDAKLLAAGGAWLGPFALPLIVMAAALAGIAYALSIGRYGRTDEVRFGPFLAAGIVLAIIVTTIMPGRVVPVWP